MLVKDMLSHCASGDVDAAYKIMSHLWKLGYSGEDIITMVFRVAKTHDMHEFLKLEFIKVRVRFIPRIHTHVHVPGMYST